MQGRKGFTLVEALVSLSLVVFVGAAAFAVFSGGFRIWGRLAGQEAQGQEIQLVLEQVRRDLVNQRNFRPISLKGAYDEVSFAAMVPVIFRDREAGTEFEVQEIGRVAYFFDSFRGALCRSEVPYRSVRRYFPKEGGRPVLSRIQRLRFSYYAADSDGENAEWSSSWDDEKKLPLAVKIELEYRDEATKQTKTQAVVVPLPTAPIGKLSGAQPGA